MSISFVPMQPSDAGLLLEWRTHPDITRHMYTDLFEPSVAKQVAWIKAMQASPSYEGFVIYDADKPVGFLCFSDIDTVHQRCSTGSYMYDKSARLKYAVTLHTYICNYAFHRLGMHKIVNYIMGANKKVEKIQALHKTRHVGILKDHVYKYGQFHDVHIFEQLKSDWLTMKQHFPLADIQRAYANWRD